MQRIGIATMELELGDVGRNWRLGIRRAWSRPLW